MLPAERFSSRVAEYRKHRPDYPPDIVAILKNAGVLRSWTIVADIGSGTGLLTRLFFAYARTVYGVEPNAAMRRQAEQDYADVANFISSPGSAEHTGLPPASIDLVTAGQAFHWFDRDKAYDEFRRILRPGGSVLLAWNYRDIEADELQRRYEAILEEFIPDYKQLDHKTMTDAKIHDFYHHNTVRKFTLPNSQRFDLDSLQGRVLSSSYVPKSPHPVAAQVLSRVQNLFDAFQQDGTIQFIYKTVLYLGRLNSPDAPAADHHFGSASPNEDHSHDR
ncbi:class I SAM-dependent methyltransferase [candidate division KSB1 bacterium]|nr:MAG: class I SAM-dependent methyltransferase [candidate division KSB1 bacterium]